ncbi:Testis-specific Y-encoded protein 10, partial [Galemys pyrenaicus]
RQLPQLPPLGGYECVAVVPPIGPVPSGLPPAVAVCSLPKPVSSDDVNRVRCTKHEIPTCTSALLHLSTPLSTSLWLDYFPSPAQFRDWLPRSSSSSAVSLDPFFLWAAASPYAPPAPLNELSAVLVHSTTRTSRVREPIVPSTAWRVRLGPGQAGVPGTSPRRRRRRRRRRRWCRPPRDGEQPGRAPSLLAALEALQLELEPVNRQASRAYCRLRLRMRQRRQPHLDRRGTVIQGIRGFWAKAVSLLLLPCGPQRGWARAEGREWGARRPGQVGDHAGHTVGSGREAPGAAGRVQGGCGLRPQRLLVAGPAHPGRAGAAGLPGAGSAATHRTQGMDGAGLPAACGGQWGGSGDSLHGGT